MKTLTKISLISILLLSLVMFMPHQNVVFAAGEPTMSLLNPTGGHDFIFYTNITLVGTRFNVTAGVTNGTKVASWQVGILYNSTILNATRAWIPNQDAAYIFYGLGTFAPPVFFNPGLVKVGELTLPLTNVTFTTPKKLATVEFEVLAVPPKGVGNKYTNSLFINTTDTYIQDSNNVEPTVYYKVNGNYELNWVKPGSQISLSASPGTVTLGSNVTLSGPITAPSNTSATFPDVPVTIWHRVGTTGAFANLTTVTTNTTSGYSYRWTSAGVDTHQFYSSWEGNADYQRANSSVVSVTVNKITTSITLTASSTSIKVGGNTTLTGQITPALSGVSVRIVIGTTNITTVTTSSTGSFTYLWEPAEAGSYDLKAVYDGDATYSSSESLAATVTVESPPTTIDWLYYAIAAIVIVIIIIVIAVYLMRRRSKK